MKKSRIKEIKQFVQESARNCIFDLRPDSRIYTLNHHKAPHSFILALHTVLDTTGNKDKKEVAPVCNGAPLNLPLPTLPFIILHLAPYPLTTIYHAYEKFFSVLFLFLSSFSFPQRLSLSFNHISTVIYR